MTNWKGPKSKNGADMEDVVRRTCTALGIAEPKQVEIALSRTQRHTTGRCWPGTQRIYVTVGLEADRASLEEVMMHECCHLVGQPVHDAAFRARVVKAAKLVFGVDASDHEKTPKVYALDSVIRKRLRVKLGLPEKREWLDPEAKCETRAAATTLPRGQWVTEKNPWVWG